MKCFLAILFVASAALAMPNNHHHHHHGGPSTHPGHPHAPHMSHELWQFAEDLGDFQELYPMEQIEAIVQSYFQDESFQATLAFLASPDFERIIRTIGETTEIEAVHNYIINADWPWIHHTITNMMARMEANKGISGRNTPTGGFSGCLDAVVAVLPREQLRALFDEKMEIRPVFRAVVEIFTSQEFKGLITNVKNSPVINAQFELLAEHGFNVGKVFTTALAFFGL